MKDNFFNTVIRPVISEKSTAQVELFNSYVFEVNPKASKVEIARAVESLFNVKVKKVRTMIVHGSLKRNAKGSFKLPNWKKAIVSLKENNKIEFFQGV